MKRSLKYSPTQTLGGAKGALYVVKYNSTGEYCITGGGDKKLRLYNPNRAGFDDDKHAFMIKEYEGPHSYPIRDVVISHDNATFASCGQDKGLFVWDVASGRVLRRWFGHDARLNAVAFNFESTVLASASYDRTTRLWDCRSASRVPIQILGDAKDSVSSVICTPTEIITGSIDGCIRVYDIRNGRSTCDSVHDPVTSLSLSHDGKCLLASCMPMSGAVLKLIEKPTGDLLNAYKGHQNSAFPLGNAFTKTDSHVVSGAEDGSIVFWDLVEGSIDLKLKGHKSPVSKIAMHPNGTHMLSVAHDGTALSWVAE